MDSGFDASHRPGVTTGVQTYLHIPATRYARVVHVSFAQRGRGECRMPKRTRSLAWKNENHTSVVTAGRAGFTRHSRTRMVLTVSFALSSGTGFVAPVALWIIPQNSTPASGRQDHTTSPSASIAPVLRRQRVHRIPRPTFVTIAKRPSCERGTAALMELIWAKREAIYFCGEDWTGSISLIGFGKFADWRKGNSMSACPPTATRRAHYARSEKGQGAATAASNLPPFGRTPLSFSVC